VPLQTQRLNHLGRVPVQHGSEAQEQGVPNEVGMVPLPRLRLEVAELGGALGGNGFYGLGKSPMSCAEVRY